MPGGGASGELVLPPAQNYAHSLMLHGATTLKPPDDDSTGTFWTEVSAGNTLNVIEEMNVSALLNPYTGVSAVDPSTELDRVDDAIDEYVDAAELLDAETLLADAVNAALENVTSEVLSDAELQASLTAFSDRTEEAYLRRVSGAAASLLGGRAVMSGGFDAAMTALANQREAEIADFSAKLGMMNHEQKSTLAVQFTNQYMQIVQAHIQARQTAVALVLESAKARILGEQDRINLDLDYDVREVQWKLDQFEYGQGVISAYSGGGPIPRPKTPGERLLGNLGGNLTGALSAGIGIGTVTKNPLIGAIAGLGVFGLTAISNVFQ